MASFEIHYRDWLTLFAWVASCSWWGGKRCDCWSLSKLGRGLRLCLLLITRGVQTSTICWIIRKVVDRAMMLLIKVLQVQLLLFLTLLWNVLMLSIWWKCGCPMHSSTAASITNVKVIHSIFVNDRSSRVTTFISWEYLLTVRRRVINLSSLIWHFVKAWCVTERRLNDIVRR